VTGEERVLDVTGVFVAIGHVPNTTLVTDQVDLEDNGYVRTGLGSFTNIDGLFAAGDVQDHVYRQAVTSAGLRLHRRNRRRALARSAGSLTHLHR
jgi:thioredoxin reductase (NADPH)